MGFIRILIGTILISIVSLSLVRGVKPIFGKYLDNRIHALLRTIAMSQDRYEMANPLSIIEADRRIDDTILKMKKYLIDDRLSRYSRDVRPQRRLFWLLWPAFEQPKKTQTRVDGNFQGGIKDDSFQFEGHFVGSYNADFNMRRRHRKRNKKKFR